MGYAGLGTRVHDSGLTHQNGRITKAGRKDLRRAMVDSANHAILHHPFWKKEFQRLEPSAGAKQGGGGDCPEAAGGGVARAAQSQSRPARRCAGCGLLLLCACLQGGCAQPAQRRDCHRLSPAMQLDRLGLGWQLQVIPWGSKKVNLPPSTLPQAQQKK